MTSQQLRDYLIKSFPEFQAQWEDSDFLHEDGAFKHHGLLLEFSFFFKDNVAKFTDKQLLVFFSDIEKWILPEEKKAKTDAENLSNAVCTCFLEGIANEGITERIKPLMGPEAWDYYQHWE